MSRKFKIPKDPYSEGYNLFEKGTVEFYPGVTTLVGCNGYGKTTLMKILQEKLKSLSVPFLSFNNLEDGGSSAMSAAAFFQDFGRVGALMQSSEGESIIINIGQYASRIGSFIRNNGQDNSRMSQLAHAFDACRDKSSDIEHNSDIDATSPDEYWFFFDAVDSGLSIDNMVEVKDLFDLIIQDARSNDIDVYIIVSTNSYEFAEGQTCLDVHSMNKMRFTCYSDYRGYILKTRDQKDMR